MELTKIILYSLFVFIVIFFLLVSIGFLSYHFKKPTPKLNSINPIKNNDSILVAIRKRTLTKITTQLVRMKQGGKKRMTVLNKEYISDETKSEKKEDDSIIWKYYSNKERKK